MLELYLTLTFTSRSGRSSRRGQPLRPPLEGMGIIGGHPQTPGRETPAPLVGSKGKVGGHSQTPGRDLAPAPLVGRVGGHPQTPGREAPAPLCVLCICTFLAVNTLTTR